MCERTETEQRAQIHSMITHHVLTLTHTNTRQFGAINLAVDNEHTHTSAKTLR